MSKKNELELVKLEKTSEQEKVRINEFILKKNTNGEFINSPLFLSYHPDGRFIDDSIVVFDAGSRAIRAVMMAAKRKVEDDIIVSHPGTTFAGPIIDRKMSIELIEEAVSIMLDYYEKKYKRIEIKLTPAYYSYQSCDVVIYFMLKRGYSLGMTGLSNIINISDLRTEEDVLNLFDAKRRNQVRKVLKEEFFVFHEEDSIAPLVWANMNRNLELKYHSKTTHTFNEICDLKSKFNDKILPFYVKTNDNIYGAFGLVFKFKNVFHTQYLDLNYEYTGKYPNLFLIMKLIQKAREFGFDYFSFGASTDKGGAVLNYSLYNYKAGYGGGDIILPFCTWEKEQKEC